MSKLRAFLRSCVATPFNVVLSAVTLLLIGWLLADLVSWAVIDAVWSGNSARACEGHDAACWVFIRLRFEQLLYGPYPASERWRVAIVAMLSVLAVGLMLMPTRNTERRRLVGLAALILLPFIAAPLLAGGFAGLKRVPTTDWGGIMLTIVIASWTIATSIPLGLLLALGRRSELPVISYACATFIELWRSLPLIGVLFLAVRDVSAVRAAGLRIRQARPRADRVHAVQRGDLRRSLPRRAAGDPARPAGGRAQPRPRLLAHHRSASCCRR